MPTARIQYQVPKLLGDPMKVRVLIAIFITWMLLSAANVHAKPLRLTVQPKGTNQISLTLSPVEPDGLYGVIARTNGPDGNWTMLAEYIGGSNSTISVTCGLGGVPGLTLNTLQNWTFVAGQWDDPLGGELPPLYKELILRIDPAAHGDPDGGRLEQSAKISEQHGSLSGVSTASGRVACVILPGYQ